MAALNRPLPSKMTYEGGPASRNISDEQQLRRAVLSCLLWEDQFYEDGKSIVERIQEFAQRCSPSVVADLAIEARSSFNLRHVPLLLLSILARTARKTSLLSETIPKVIQRADELSELLAVHAEVNKTTPDKIKKTLSAQMKKGLALAFQKFNEYALAKYDRAGAIRLRDVLFLCHAKPRDQEQDALWKRLIANELQTPDTWEVELSASTDKKASWTRLLTEGKLGYLALLRNLRNMAQAGVDEKLIQEAILARKGGAERVLPFRYTAAARVVPSLEPWLDLALLEAIKELPRFEGTTAVLVDVSGSMNTKLSGKSDITMMDAAATLASVINGRVKVYSFSDDVVECPPRKGMAGVDAIVKSQRHTGTQLGKAIEFINKSVSHDRIIVITDEQSHDRVPGPVVDNAYIINVASYQNGVGYGAWTHINGFSEQVLRYIQEIEKEYNS